jgi:cytoskeletal protein RodZ
MALFKRKKKDSVLPEEVRDYYTAEKRDRKGMAWLLAVATLIVTFLIAAALFFGGRWVYRTVFDNKEKNTTTQEESADKTANEESMELGDQKASGNSGSSSSSSSSSSNGTPGSSTGTSSTNTTQTPVTGPSELVNTGPGDE